MGGFLIWGLEQGTFTPLRRSGGSTLGMKTDDNESGF